MRQINTIKALAIAIGTFLSCGAYSQNWQPVSQEAFKEVIAKCSAQNNKENYSIDFKRTVYAHATDTKPLVASHGKLWRGQGKEYRLESEKQLLIQNDAVKMVIDSTQQLILLMKPDTLFEQVNPEQMFASADFMAATFSQLKTGTVNRFRIQFEAGSSSYQDMELTLDAKTYAIAKIEFRLVAANYMSDNFEDMTEEQPRVVVEYKPMVQLKAGKHFDQSHWIKLSGEKYELQPRINYTLDDLRIN